MFIQISECQAPLH